MNKEEKQESKRLPGFYIALCCCVIAVGIAGYFTERASNNQNGGSDISGGDTTLSQPEIVAENPMDDSVAANAGADDVDYDTPPHIYVEAEGAPVQSEEESTAADAPKIVYEDLSDNGSAAVETASIVGEASFAAPADGEILEEFSDTLAFNTALGDWRTHNGIDIAVASGGSVTAAADGTISKISSDAMGEYVIIDHGNGFTSKYCSLASVEELTEGSTITAGEVIGIAAEGKTENVKECHLHFELYKDGIAVNPSDYIG